MLFLSTNPVKQLRRILGTRKVFGTPEILALYSVDATQFKRRPQIVVFAEKAEDISLTVKFAAEEGFSITPRGAGSGLSGGSVPYESQIVLSCERMKDIELINLKTKTAFVEPGVITADLQKAVLKKGLFYPPDPSSNTISTIGGNVAENAGGLRCFKYGVTGHYVLGLEYIDAKAQIQKTGIFNSQTQEPDLTSLFVGSEGSLGIVSKIALRLIPPPPRSVTIAACFNESSKAFQSIEDLLKSGMLPSVLEFLDHYTISSAAQHCKIILAPETRALILMELDGSLDGIESKTATRILTNHSFKVEIATEKKHREKLWLLRKSISPSLIRLSSGIIHEDIAVPRGKLYNFYQQAVKISLSEKIRIAVFGHAGDGNLHINILFDNNSPSSA
ncbi:FAD-binding protein, partial [bacterium]|nr:FAD-binding protein [bacterium]